MDIGSRVGVKAATQDDLVVFLGYGVYEGNFVPPFFPTFEEAFPEHGKMAAAELDFSKRTYERLCTIAKINTIRIG